jgi:hypothetical protein
MKATSVANDPEILRIGEPLSRRTPIALSAISAWWF